MYTFLFLYGFLVSAHISILYGILLNNSAPRRLPFSSRAATAGQMISVRYHCIRLLLCDNLLTLENLRAFPGNLMLAFLKLELEFTHASAGDTVLVL